MNPKWNFLFIFLHRWSVAASWQTRFLATSERVIRFICFCTLLTCAWDGLSKKNNFNHFPTRKILWKFWKIHFFKVTFLENTHFLPLNESPIYSLKDRKTKNWYSCGTSPSTLHFKLTLPSVFFFTFSALSFSKSIRFLLGVFYFMRFHGKFSARSENI